MQKIILGIAFFITVCSIFATSNSPYLPSDAERKEDAGHHNQWNWHHWHQPHPTTKRPTGPTAPTHSRKPWHRPTTKSRPKTTMAPTPGPEICSNRTKVSNVDDEKGPVVCLRRSDKELMDGLSSVGGYIRRYMAVNVSDACGFVDLTGVVDERPTMAAPQFTTSSSSEAKDEGVNSHEALQRMKRSIPTTPGTIIRGCQGRGTMPDGSSLRRMCTECAATTRLRDDRYPRYINEVVCRDKDRQCAARMGVCFQRTLKLPFLELTGDFQIDKLLSALTGKTVYKEVWVPYTQEIRSCCECRVYGFVYQTFASRRSG